LRDGACRLVRNLGGIENAMEVIRTIARGRELTKVLAILMQSAEARLAVAIDVVGSPPFPSFIGPARVPWSVWPWAATTVGLMAVSLTRLSDGVTQFTAIIPYWQPSAMAVGIHCMLISVALAQLMAPHDVKRDIAIVARCIEAGTLLMSAGLNALAFTGGAFDAAHWAQVAFGCFVPAAISGATYILARLTRR
jgi:hypothetical protein